MDRMFYWSSSFIVLWIALISKNVGVFVILPDDSFPPFRTILNLMYCHSSQYHALDKAVLISDTLIYCRCFVFSVIAATVTKLTVLFSSI